MTAPPPSPSLVSSPVLAAWAAKGRQLRVHGHDIFMADLPCTGPAGVDAPISLILHGFPTSSVDWALAAPILQKHFRVIIHDHLGFGLSDKPSDYSYSLLEQAEFALGVWAQLGVTSGHLLAHDYGTSVATELIARRERVGLPVTLRSLTLCNGSVHIDMAKLSWPQLAMRNRRIGPLFSKLASRRLFLSRIRKTFGDRGAVDISHLDAMWEGMTRAGGRAALTPISQYLHERRRFAGRWIGALTRLTLPTRIIWGDQDPIAVPAIATQLASETPGAGDPQWLNGLGHYPMLEGPEAFAQAIIGDEARQ